MNDGLSLLWSTLLLLGALLLPLGTAGAQSTTTTASLSGAEAIAAHVRSAPPGAASTNALGFSPDGSRIASYTGEQIAIWDSKTGERLQTMPGQERYVYQTQWSPDGTVLASASVDGTIHLWDVATGEPLQVLDGFSGGARQMGGGITEVLFSPDGRYLAAGQRFTPGRLVVWDREAETEVLRVERPRKMYSVAWGPNGDRLYTAEENGTVYGWSFPGGEQVNQWQLEKGQLFSIDAADTRVVTGGKAETVHVLDPERGAVLHQFDHGDFLNNTAVVPEQPTVASVSSNGVLRVWDTDTGTLRYERFSHDTGTWTVKASPDGTFLATTGSDNYIRLWDPTTGALLREISGR
jgi:WD40 repeat protein